MHNVFYNQGWICPKCGKTYSPTITECYRCNSNQKTYLSDRAVSNPVSTNFKYKED